MTCTEYRPDHNGECQTCDEPAEAHALLFLNRVHELLTENAELRARIVELEEAAGAGLHEERRQKEGTDLAHWRERAESAEKARIDLLSALRSAEAMARKRTKR